MATTTDKTLIQLIEQFTEASNQTKELNKVISNFTTITDEFRETLLYIEEQIPAKDMANLSQQAIDRLKEVKSYNEMQVLELIETAVNKQVSSHVKEIQKKIVDSSKENLNKIDNKFKRLNTSIKAELSDAKQNDQEKDSSEILSLLKKVEQQTRYSGQNPLVNTQNNEEIHQLRRIVSSLTGKIKKLEETYEERIVFLENEIEILKANHPNGNVQLVEITDEDLPF
jgi:hypothetical protein